jgi:hypothetical protein
VPKDGASVGLEPSEMSAIVGFCMHERAIDRARERLAEASAARPGQADLAAALERAHAQLSELSQIAAGIELELPDQVETAVREGMRKEAAPVGRQLAEVRGLATQIARRLERLEAELGAERFARVDDLGLLVDLISSGWTSVDERLSRIERLLGGASGTVHRLDARRAEP